MERTKLFKKYYKNENHDYEISETLSYHDETNRPPDICFVYSGRNRGKSFEVSTQLLADSYFDNNFFGYIRRNDATVYEIEQYFADKTDFIKDMTDGVSDGITLSKGKLYLCHYEDEKRVLDKPVGYFFALSRQSSYKSLQFPEIRNLLFEEVLTDQTFLSAEPEKLMNLYSTCRRSKTDFTMWLISNTISVVNPYSNSWGIKLAQNKAGEVRLSKLYLGVYDENQKEQYLLIAAHYLKDKGTLTKEDQNKKRNRIKTAIASNKWEEAKLYTTLPLKYVKQYKPIETVVFEYEDLMFQVDIVELPENIMKVYKDSTEEDPIELNTREKIPTLYVRRKTTQPKEKTRLYTNNPDRFSQYATDGYKIICRLDMIVDKLIQRGWILGADNLTMNDFFRCFNSLRRKYI